MEVYLYIIGGSVAYFLLGMFIAKHVTEEYLSHVPKYEKVGYILMFGLFWPVVIVLALIYSLAMMFTNR